ncbi:histidine kinase [Pseudoduganella buxea]|uniref:histidine kinase n=1 Tax=Pseudoduganella buxea TaxID=1949069 RepID=A0ABQ1KIL1_9BURK|nr:histidine kinase [Pseudoduganella buxea]
MVTGAALSIGAAFWQDRFNDAVILERLSAAAGTAADHAVQRMGVYQYGLRGLRGFILTVGPDVLRMPDLERYSRTRDIATEFPGARGLGFIRRVARAQAREFERHMQTGGIAGAKIRELAPHDGDRFVIEYIEPLAPNRAAVGFDIASEANRRQAALAAMDGGTAQLTAPITLLQESGKHQRSFLLLLPVYDGPGTPVTVQERRRSLKGWTYAPLVIDELLHTLGLDPTRIDLGVSDITDRHNEQVIVPLAPANVHPVYLYSTVVNVYGRQWRLKFHARPAFTMQQGTMPARWVLLGGLVVSSLAAALSGSIAGNRWRRRQITATHARLAAIVENSNDAILGNTLDGIVTTWNGGAEALFGYSKAEAVGRTVAELIVPIELRQEEADILARLARGETVAHFDTVRLCRDGSKVTVSVTASPIRDATGTVVGASKTVRDITERKSMEALAERTYKEMAIAVSNRTSQLRKLNILLDSVLGSLELAIIATDDRGVISVFNRGAENLLGYGAAEMVGRASLAMLVELGDIEARLDPAVLPVERDAGMRAVLRAACAREPETSEWTYLCKSGEKLPVSVAISALRDGPELTGYLSIAMDVSQLRRAQAELQRQHAELLLVRDHLLLAADVARLGVWSWRLDGRSPEWNAHMFAIYGIEPDPGGTGPGIDDWLAMVHPDDVIDARGRLDAIAQGQGEHDHVFRILRKDGQIRYLQSATRTEYDGEGMARQITGISLDVTERMELVNTLRQAKEEADAASQAKSNFLANMSHEIRTPLNAVLGMLQILKQSGLAPHQQDYAVKATSAARSLLQLLNDLLDYSKIEAGKLVLDVDRFNLRELLNDLSIILSGTLGAKEVEIMFDLDPTLPVELLGDRLRLQQVLINLTGNALKFTERGDVVLSVQRMQDSNEQRTRFTVSDTGIGIAPEQQQAIFESFTQAETSISRRFGGTGLGLVIAQRLVRMMGSELLLDSAPGVGSRFWFEVDLPATDDSLALVTPPPMKPVRVLVVDDNPLAAALLGRMVESLGWQVRLAGSGEEAIDTVAGVANGDGRFDVVLMDWNMPGLNGTGAARRIAELAGVERPPVIIMVTAYGREAMTSIQTEDGGAAIADMLTKPVMPHLIVDAVSRALKLAPGEHAHSFQGSHRLDGMHILLAEDNQLNQQVAYILLTQEGACVTVAENGREAVGYATNNLFDAVLMDMQMPVMDGLEATRHIRAVDRLKDLPIIAMTANAAQADRQACLAAGMNAHIAKPIDIGQVVDVLTETCQSRSAGEDACFVEPFADIMRRFGGAADIYARLLEALPEQAARLLATIDGSLDVAQHRDPAATLHTLKGTASTLGAQGLAEEIARLERGLREDPQSFSASMVAAIDAGLQRSMLALRRQLAAHGRPVGDSGNAACPHAAS